MTTGVPSVVTASRNRKDSANYKNILGKYGVALISVLEQMDDSPESIILESTLEGLSEYYSRNLSREVMKGMRESALNCQFTGGQAPFGFAVEKETLKFMVNEEEAQIVRLIFQLAADGIGYTEILNRLKALGVKTRRGNDFSKPSLYELLRNEKYNGVYVFNRAVSKDGDGKRNNHRSKSLDDQIRIENGMPRIVDAELFEAVQQILDNRKRGTRNGIKREYPLAGSVFCGQCGHRCSGDVMLSGHTVKTPVGIYTCNNRANRGAQACQSKTIRQEPLEAFVREKISDVVFPGVLQAYERFVQTQENDDGSNIKIMRQQLKSVEQRIANLVNVISQTGNATLVAELQRKENEKNELLIKIGTEERKLKNHHIDPEKVISTYRKARELFFEWNTGGEEATIQSALG